MYISKLHFISLIYLFDYCRLFQCCMQHVVCTFSFCNNKFHTISSMCTLNFNPYFLYESRSSNCLFLIKMYVSVNLCVFHYLCINSLLYASPLITSAPVNQSLNWCYMSYKTTPMMCTNWAQLMYLYFNNISLKTLTNTAELRFIIRQRKIANTDNLRIGILPKRLTKYDDS